MSFKSGILTFDELSSEMEILENDSIRKIQGGKYPPVKEQPIDIPTGNPTSVGGGGGGYLPSMDNTSPSYDSGGGYIVDNTTYISDSGDPYNKVSFDNGQSWVNEPLNVISQDNMPAWQAALNVISAGGEITIGIVGMAETGGISVYLIVDGITRLGLNTANLVDPSAIGTSSLGGLIGRGLGGQYGQRLGEMINDGITAGVGGGALASGIEAGEALIQGQNAKAFYFIIDGGNSAINAYNTSQNGNH